MFRSAGNLASLLFPSSSSSPSSSSKRSTPRRRSSANEPPSDGSSLSGPGYVGEFGEDLSATTSSSAAGSRRPSGGVRDSQLSQATVNGHATAPPSPGSTPSVWTFGGGTTSPSGHRQSSDLASQRSLTSTGPSAPTSARGSPLPSRKQSATLARSPSSLGELDLGPELKIDALVHNFAASGSREVAVDRPLKGPDVIPHSASAPLSEPLASPPSLGRHARSDSAPTVKALSKPASPIRVIYYASEMTPADEQQRPKPVPATVDAVDSGKALNKQALEGIHGWQQDVWVTLRSETSSNVFHANPRTGECSWEPPTGALVSVLLPQGSPFQSWRS
jgi:hypothetical protein